LFIDPIIGFVL